MSPLQKGYVTAETRRSQRKTLLRITHTHAARFVCRVLCALGVSAVRFCSKVYHAF